MRAASLCKWVLVFWNTVIIYPVGIVSCVYNMLQLVRKTMISTK